MHILFILEQSAIKRRDGGFIILAAQRFRRHVFNRQQLQPIQQFGCRGLFLQFIHIAHIEKHRQCFPQQILADIREMRLHDFFHRLPIREADVMEEAAAQKRVRQFLFIVGGDDHHWPMPRLDAATQLIDIEFHAIDLKQ